MAATTEAKAAEPKEVEENSGPTLKYKTWVLRVSVHCEGCKKKVIKILKNIDGVYKTEVDMRLQKVTVTGNVEAETLIKKLTKTGKHAELWPEQKPNNNSNDKKKNKGKGKEKLQSDSEISEETSHGQAGGGGGDNGKETVKVEGVQVQNSAKKNNGEGASTCKIVDGGNMAKASEGGGAPAKTGGAGGGQVREPKPEMVRQGGNSQNQPPVAEKKSGGGESDCEIEKIAGGGGEVGGASGSGGKKKKKGQKGNAANVEVYEDERCDDDAPPSTGLPNRGNVAVVPNGPNYQHISQFPNGVFGPNGPRMPLYGPQGPRFVPALANHGLPPQQAYDYYRPPVQAVSYNTAYPTYGASHYATPAHQGQSYNYVTPQGVETELEPRSYHSDPYRYQQYYPAQPSYHSAPPPSDSFQLFSDENPNGCKIM